MRMLAFSCSTDATPITAAEMGRLEGVADQRHGIDLVGRFTW